LVEFIKHNQKLLLKTARFDLYLEVVLGNNFWLNLTNNDT